MNKNRVVEESQQAPPQKLDQDPNDKEALPQGHGRIEIAGVVLEAEDVTKLNNILEGNYTLPQQEGVKIEEQKELKQPAINQKVVLQQSIADAKMTALMSQTLQSKEQIIKSLEEELKREQDRRK